MNRNPPPQGASVITSLPDVSELPLGLLEWKRWFTDAARAVIRWVPPEGLALFYQSDVRRQAAWVDKSYLVMRAAESEGATVVWHAIVCRKPPGTLSQGRASYSHLLVVAMRPSAPRLPRAAVLPDPGSMPWSRARGGGGCGGGGTGRATVGLTGGGAQLEQRRVVKISRGPALVAIGPGDVLVRLDDESPAACGGHVGDA